MACASGIPVLGELQPGSHIGQFYWDQYDLLETLVPYFVAGLRSDERCMWICAPPLCAADARAALAKSISDLADREARGEILIRDHEDRDPDAMIVDVLAAEQQALLAGYRGLRVAAHACVVTTNGWREHVAREERMHDAFRTRQIVAICGYPLSRCGSRHVTDVLDHHSCSLVRGTRGWEVVRSTTAALTSLDRNQLTIRLANEIAHRQVLDAAYASARDAREHLVMLNRLTGALGEVSSRGQFVDVVRDAVMQALAVTSVAVVEIADSGELVQLVAHGAAADTLCHAAGLAGTRPMWNEPATVLGGAIGIESFALVPMAVGARRLGVLVLGYERQRELCGAYRALAEDVARQLALALDRAISYERLEHERERAESASRAKDEFLAMLGHELRNPLSPILTATQLMRLRGEDLLEKERTVIERQVRHMIRLVDDLLDVSRITRGKVNLRRRSIEIAEIVAQAVELASPAMEERAHRLSIDVPSQGLVVLADLHRLSQVIANLLTNAAKYTPQGGDIQLTARPTDTAVILTVSDNGIGIDESLLPHIFDHFVQGRQGIDRASGGLGLGLAIARTLVELHGGAIAARSNGPGRGSEFSVTLPRHARARTARGSQNSGAFALATLRPLSVLVVDDNEDAAFLFSEALRKLGHNVDVAYDGPSALYVARERPPEIAFLDIGLPVMDGYELGRRLRELNSIAPKLVALTGYGHTSDRDRSREAGFDLHLVKPVDLNAIQEALAKLVA